VSSYLSQTILKGTYTILLICSEPFRLKLGSLGCVKVKKGYFVYTGSALGPGSVSLEGRINRHRRRSKNVRWHIDYLTTRREIHTRGSVSIRSRARLECLINTDIIKKLRGCPLIERAGASDCKCRGHLLRVREQSSGVADLIDQLSKIYAAFGVPITQRYS